MENLSTYYLNQINQLLGKESLTEEDEKQIFYYCSEIERINEIVS